MKPAKRQKHPQYWVIESFWQPSEEPDVVAAGLGLAKNPEEETWNMTTEAVASGRMSDMEYEFTPRRLETVLNILKTHIANVSNGRGIWAFSDDPNVHYRVRNIKTGEIIPWEAITA